MPRSDAMIDIETLGTGDDAVILSIGAIGFDAVNLTVNREDYFYVRLAWDEKSQPGRVITPGTLAWWLMQDPKVFAETRAGTVSLRDGLRQLAEWLGDRKSFKSVWCNGANFDFGILGHAYTQIGAQIPWGYGQEACMRSLRRVFKLDLPRFGNHHNALDDAAWQADWVVAALRGSRG